MTRAGGFGVLGATSFSPGELEVELRWIDDAVSGMPYGVDMLIPHKYVGSESGGLAAEALAERVPAGHRQFLDDLLERHGVEPIGAERVFSDTGLSEREALELVHVRVHAPDPVGREPRSARRPQISSLVAVTTVLSLLDWRVRLSMQCANAMPVSTS